MLLQGSVRPRPSKAHSQAHPGVHPLSPLTHRSQRFQPLPEPLGEPPYHYELATAIPGIDQSAAHLGHLTFHMVGDTGGIKHPQFQRDVAAAMKTDLNRPANQRPAFFYHLGDVIYYNGEITQYYDQFYEPYDHYHAPIFSIPGNHDGDPVPNSGQTSLAGWVKYFMTPKPHVDPVSMDAPRVTMSQPNVYFTLNCPFVTIIGLYSNVPEGGSIESVQQQWFTHELATAPKNKAVIVCVHHPIYSFDDHHSGSPQMADILQAAINDSRRVPNLVMTAHVHNYQRIEKKLLDGQPTPFIVAGNGGYYHLHGMNGEAGVTDETTGATLIANNEHRHGYLTLTVNANTIEGKTTLIDDLTHKPTKEQDSFSYSAKAHFLPEGVMINL